MVRVEEEVRSRTQPTGLSQLGTRTQVHPANVTAPVWPPTGISTVTKPRALHDLR